MKSKKYFIFLSFLVVGIAYFNVEYRRRSVEKEKALGLGHSTKDQQSKEQFRPLRDHAMEPVNMDRTIGEVSTNREKTLQGTLDNIPMPCRNPALMNEILVANGNHLLDMAYSKTEGFSSCLIELDGPKECLDVDPVEDEASNVCRNNLLIARAHLIDKIYENQSIETLDINILANKVISKIYNSSKSIEENGPEIFDLTDRIIALDPDNQEAHNLRAYAAIPKLRQNFDAQVLEKGKESTANLRNFSDQKFTKRGIISSFAFDMIDYLVTQSPRDLDDADLLADAFLAQFPERPEGYHMKATVTGYRDNMELCKEWTQKGLKVGGETQPGYSAYQEIIKRLDAKTMDKRLLGVRFDSSELFRPDEILQ